MNINTNSIIEIIKIAIAAGVAAWGINEYYYKDHLSKIDRAHDYISEHVNVANVKTEVDYFWVRNLGAILVWDRNLNKDNQDVDVTDQRYQKSTYDTIKKILTDENNSDITKKVHYLQHFYYNVSVCLNDELCDIDTICDGFFGDIFTYRSIHINYIHEFEKAMSLNKDTQIRSLLQKCEQREKRLSQARRKETAVNTATQK